MSKSFNELRSELINDLQNERIRLVEEAAAHWVWAAANLSGYDEAKERERFRTVLRMHIKGES